MERVNRDSDSVKLDGSGLVVYRQNVGAIPSCRLYQLSFGKLSKSASARVGMGGIVVDSELQRQAPRGGESSRSARRNADG